MCFISNRTVSDFCTSCWVCNTNGTAGFQELLLVTPESFLLCLLCIQHTVFCVPWIFLRRWLLSYKAVGWTLLPEDGGNMSLRNLDILPQHHTGSQPQKTATWMFIAVKISNISRPSSEHIILPNSEPFNEMLNWSFLIYFSDFRVGMQSL